MLPDSQWRIVKTIHIPNGEIRHICSPIPYHFPNKTAALKSIQNMQANDLSVYGNNSHVTYETFLCKKVYIENHYEWDYRDCKIIANPKGNRFKVIRDNHMTSRRHHLDDALADIDQLHHNEKYLRS